jgi:hypothetical protein
MQASKHEVEHAEVRRHHHPRRHGAGGVVIAGADGRATALRVMRCEAKMVGGKLDIKNIEGTEEDIEADLIVSAIGQAVDFTGWRSSTTARAPSTATRTTRCRGKPGVFVGGDVVRPHLLTTAIGHGAIAADGIDRFLREALEKRPKIDVHSLRPDAQDDRKGLEVQRSHEPTTAPTRAQVPSTTSTTAPTATSSAQGAVPRPLQYTRATGATSSR